MTTRDGAAGRRGGAGTTTTPTNAGVDGSGARASGARAAGVPTAGVHRSRAPASGVDVARAARDFAAGAAAVLTVHQALLWGLHRAGAAPWPAYALAPTRPFGVPAVASAAFWGGAWWGALARLRPRSAGAGAYYRRAALLGAVAPNAAGALLLALGHGPPLGGAPPAAAALSAVLVNGAWALAAAAAAAAAGRRR